MDPELERLRRQVAVTARFWRRGQWFLLGVASLVIIAACARGIWFLAVVGGLMFAAFWGMTAAMLRKSDWENNPLLRTLREDPLHVVRVEHRIATSSSGAFPHSYFVVRDRQGNSFAFRVPSKDRDEVAHALETLCPQAIFSGPHFDQR